MKREPMLKSTVTSASASTSAIWKLTRKPSWSSARLAAITVAAEIHPRYMGRPVEPEADLARLRRGRADVLAQAAVGVDEREEVRGDVEEAEDLVAADADGYEEDAREPGDEQAPYGAAEAGRVGLRGCRQNDREPDEPREDDPPDGEGVAGGRDEGVGVVLEAALAERVEVDRRHGEEGREGRVAVEGRERRMRGHRRAGSWHRPTRAPVGGLGARRCPSTEPAAVPYALYVHRFRTPRVP